jgi:hypothetical protein
VLAVALTALAAACGGEGTGAESLSREEFVARANEICRDALQDTAYPRNPKGDEEIAEALDAAAAAVRNLDSRLRDLRPPPELASDVEAWLRNGDSAANTLNEAADAVRKNGRFAVLEMMPGLAEDEKESDRLARKIGATECIGPD